MDTIACIKAEQPFPVPRNNLYDRFMSGPVNPIFGKITDGMEQIRWMEQLETYPVPYPDAPDVKINTCLLYTSRCV